MIMLRFLDRSTQVTDPAFLDRAPVMAPHPLPTSKTLGLLPREPPPMLSEPKEVISPREEIFPEKAVSF